ncbi:MAG: hypothetical protein ABIG44_15825 [Planctomycetota bacterium]
MTVALCTNCGSLKHGAWCECPDCEAGPFDSEVGILLSDHNLTEEELRILGKAVATIRTTDHDEETRFLILMYFISRKWPKLLEFSIEAVPEELQETLESVYREHLQGLPGQDSPNLQVSPVALKSWERATGERYQDEDEAWQRTVVGVLMQGIEIAKSIVRLHVDAGEGAVLQRLKHGLHCLFRRKDYRAMAGRAEQVLGDATAYQRDVDQFCNAVRNGWSDRTKEQAACFRGLCLRMIEMAEHCKTVIEYKAGITHLIDIDFRRTKQQFQLSYRTYVDLAQVVLHPTEIQPS